MDLNLIVNLDYNKQFFIKTIALRDKKARKYVFDHHCTPAAKHPVLFKEKFLQKLAKKRQAVHLTLSGPDEIETYYDLAAQRFHFEGEYLVADDSSDEEDKREGYHLKIEPNAFLKMIETKEFRSLPQSEQADRLYHSIPREEREAFFGCLKLMIYFIRRTCVISFGCAIY